MLTLLAGIYAASRARKMQSFSAWCLAARPGACLHTRVYARRVNIGTATAGVSLAEVNSICMSPFPEFSTSAVLVPRFPVSRFQSPQNNNH